MSNLYVVSRIPLDGAPRRNKRPIQYPANTIFRVLSYDGLSCEIKRRGKGNHQTIEVSTAFLDLLLPSGERISFRSAKFGHILMAVGVKVL